MELVMGYEKTSLKEILNRIRDIIDFYLNRSVKGEDLDFAINRKDFW
jgi:hypothetical protein